MENNETQVDPKILRLRELRRMQCSSDPWTEENRQELLNLQKELTSESVISNEERTSLFKRQAHAGEDGQPPLTDEERKKIQEINGLL